MLFVEHKGCLMWTAEGFEDVVGASRGDDGLHGPEAERRPGFAELLREFCERASRP